MSNEVLSQLGPLAALAGVWEGDKGDDIAPSDDRGIENNKFHERITFEPIKPVQNHEQSLYGLRYSKVAWRIGETDAFHEETGYWLWDPAAGHAMRCFIVPRGVAVIAGGSATPQAKAFTLAAELGSPTYGICSNTFLHENFRTVRFEVKVTIHSENSFSYEEDTVLQMPGQSELFHHRDKNTLVRAGR
jgi:hypothetical protein